MSTLSPQQTQLMQGWADVQKGAGQALAWIADVRGNAPRLDSEADSLSLRLRRARNQAKRLGRVAGLPMTVGFFGLSQAGKSYLISALAAGSNGKLETQYGDARLDFIAHVNPVGGGKEATGLVTRFSRSAQSGSAEFPVELRLFSEIDLAKILANAWFNDFDHERIDYTLDEARVARCLSAFEHVAEGAAAQPGVDADDVVSLWDYLQSSFGKSVGILASRYWPRVLHLAPRLSSIERANLFSILWGEQPELTQVYVQLAAALARLGHADTVFAPLECLVKREGDTYVPRDSIMNVEVLAQLGGSRDVPLTVLPVHADGRRQPVSVPVAQLAALTTELIFPLVEPPHDPQIEQVDLLDFPGYRGRKKIRSVAEAGSGGDNPVAELILRGKVAYLFERYTDSQEMNGLVVCTSSDKQSDVNDVGPVLTRWIEKTQGADEETRGRRKPGLLWAITMFDKRIAGSLAQNENQMREGWDGLIKMALLERFQQYAWLGNWAHGQPFSNTFLVRKPRLPAPFLTLDAAGTEVALAPSFETVLDALGRTFQANESVQRHVQNPGEAWEAMLALNDGGMTRISRYLSTVATMEVKVKRLQEQLDEMLTALVDGSLAHWHHNDGTGALARKQETATVLWRGISGRLKSLGELINQLELPGEVIRDLYLSGGEEDDVAADPLAPVTADAGSFAEPSFGGLGELSFGDEPAGGSAFGVQAAPVVQAPVFQSLDHRFARAVFNAWIAHLRDLPQHQPLLDMLALDKTFMDLLVEELVTAANRLDLQATLREALLQRMQSGTRRDQMVERQVLTTQTVLRDFVAWFGLLTKAPGQRPALRGGGGGAVFSVEPVLGVGELPSLPAQTSDQTQVFALNWASALVALVLENAGHSAGREISVEQNTRLGQVLAAFGARGASYAR